MPGILVILSIAWLLTRNYEHCDGVKKDVHEWIGWGMVVVSLILVLGDIMG